MNEDLAKAEQRFEVPAGGKSPGSVITYPTYVSERKPRMPRIKLQDPTYETRAQETRVSRSLTKEFQHLMSSNKTNQAKPNVSGRHRSRVGFVGCPRPKIIVLQIHIPVRITVYSLSLLKMGYSYVTVGRYDANDMR